MTSEDRHFRNSSYREKVVENIFVGELLRYLWASYSAMVDILRPEVDSGGYDIIVSQQAIVRHVQLKASLDVGKSSRQNINESLAAQPSGCVIWIVVDDSLNFKGYLWFGGKPGHPLPDITKFKQAKNTRANAEGVK
jgi:hypothetical protein